MAPAAPTAARQVATIEPARRCGGPECNSERQHEEQDEDGAGPLLVRRRRDETEGHEDEQEDEAIAAARLQSSQEWPDVHAASYSRPQRTAASSAFTPTGR